MTTYKKYMRNKARAMLDGAYYIHSGIVCQECFIVEMQCRAESPIRTDEELNEFTEMVGKDSTLRSRTLAFNEIDGEKAVCPRCLGIFDI